ncbi:MAG: class I SAM-dependent methyltransferase [Acidobacteriota bacterium]
MTSELDSVAKLWGEKAETRAKNSLQGWLDSALVLEEIVQKKQTGSPTTNWLVGLIERLRIPKEARWLSLGCGAAGTEIWIAKLGLAGSIDARDASPAALETARRACAAEGVGNVTFDTIDLNEAHLPRGPFDVVLMNMSLHHVRELDRLLGRVAAALKPGGFLLANEFVGARQFQFPGAQLGVVRDLLAALPERLRDDGSGSPKASYHSFPLEHWNLHDPSEAVRSDQILAAVARRFEIVFRANYGGTILALLLEHIVQNFSAERPGDVELLRLLGAFEDVLVERLRVLPSDYAVLAGRRPRGGPLLHRLRRAFAAAEGAEPR